MNKYENIAIEKFISDIDYEDNIKVEYGVNKHFESELKTLPSLYPINIKDPANTIEKFELKSESQTIKENAAILNMSKTSKAISKENSTLKKNMNKNSLKLFGNLFIKYFLGLKFKNNAIIENILQEYEKNNNDKSNFSIYAEFREWVKNEGVKYFQNFEIFSTLSQHCIEIKLDGDKHTQNIQATFEKILYKLFKYFLETEIYECMIHECSKEKKNKDNKEKKNKYNMTFKTSQMSLIPKLLKGLCDPKGIKSWS